PLLPPSTTYPLSLHDALPICDVVAAVLLRQMEAWTNAQSELLSGMAALWTDWMKRQREAIEATAQSLQQMFECRNLADLAQIQQDRKSTRLNSSHQIISYAVF